MSKKNQFTGKYDLLPFKEYYDSLPVAQKRILLKKLTTELCTDRATIYRWMSRDSYPGKIKVEKLSILTGLEFPLKTN